MDSRGQVSAELLFLVLIVLIILSSVTIPLVSNAVSSSMAVSQVSDAKSALGSISDAVNIVYANGPGAKRTLNVYIPQNTALSVDTPNSLLEMAVTGINYKDSNNATQTSKNVSSSIDSTNIAPNTLTLNKGWRQITVYWDPTTGNTNSGKIVITVV